MSTTTETAFRRHLEDHDRRERQLADSGLWRVWLWERAWDRWRCIATEPEANAVARAANAMDDRQRTRRRGLVIALPYQDDPDTWAGRKP